MKLKNIVALDLEHGGLKSVPIVDTDDVEVQESHPVPSSIDFLWMMYKAIGKVPDGIIHCLCPPELEGDTETLAERAIKYGEQVIKALNDSCGDLSTRLLMYVLLSWVKAHVTGALVNAYGVKEWIEVHEEVKERMEKMGLTDTMEYFEILELIEAARVLEANENEEK